MRLRTVIVADVAVLIVAAVVFAALFPSNVDSDETSPIYTGAFLVGILALIALVIIVLIGIAERLTH